MSCTEAEPCVAIGFPCGDPCYDQTGEYRCSECVQAPPVFAAGPDRSVDEGDTVSLAGALIEETLCEPAAVTPTWRQIVGPPVTLSDASSPTPTFTTPPVGSEQTLTFAFGVSGSEDTIDVVVLNVNNPPAALADAYDVVEDTTLNVPAAGVLVNDSDPDGDPLTAVLESGASHGSVQVNTDGSFSYTPSAEYSGADTFTYRAEDPSGERSEPVSVELTVRPVDNPPTAAVAGGACTTGTDAVVDLVIGDVDSDLADVTVRVSVSDPRLVPGAIAGGDDTIDGQNGDDILRGGAGNDTILGGAGGDRLEGEAGNDAMTGGSGGDAFSGGDGTDTITDLTPGQGDIDDGTSP